MSFRQFPATGADGESYVIIEFRDEEQDQLAPQHDVHDQAPRYELADGRHLIRDGQYYTTTGGDLRLSAG